MAVLGAVKTDFVTFGDLLAKTKKQLDTVSNTLGAAEVRTRAIERKLRGVEALPEAEAAQLLSDDKSFVIDIDSEPEPEPEPDIEMPPTASRDQSRSDGQCSKRSQMETKSNPGNVAIPETLWREALEALPFLAIYTEAELARLRRRVVLFLSKRASSRAGLRGDAADAHHDRAPGMRADAHLDPAITRLGKRDRLSRRIHHRPRVRGRSRSRAPAR